MYLCNEWPSISDRLYNPYMAGVGPMDTENSGRERIQQSRKNNTYFMKFRISAEIHQIVSPSTIF